MKFIFEVLVEIEGFADGECCDDYLNDLETAVADALQTIEVELDSAAEEPLACLTSEVTVNLKLEDWS